jgi:uncharacterized protein
MPGRFAVSITHGRDNPDKASVGFIAANAALGCDKEVTVFLSIEAVRLAAEGYADDIQEPGLPPLKQIMSDFTDNGGVIWACTICVKKRGLEDAKLVPGAKIMGAAVFIELLSEGVACMNF